MHNIILIEYFWALMRGVLWDGGLNCEYFDLLYFFNIMGYNFGVQLLPQLFPFNLNFQTLKKCFSEITRGFRRCRYKVVGMDRENRKTRKSVYSYTSPPTYWNNYLNYKSSIPPPLKYRMGYDEQSKWLYFKENR